MMKLIHEDQILDAKFRKAVIKDIEGTENVDRKKRALRAHECYRDKTSKWVIEQLKNEGLKPETLIQMQNRASNLSLARIAVDKKARCYSGGVDRTVNDNASKEAIDQLVDLLDADTKLKKADKFREVHKNTIMQCVPVLNTFLSEEKELFDLNLRVYSPWEYDVIEDGADREKAKVYILSEFPERYRGPQTALRPGGDGRNNLIGDIQVQHTTNRKDDLIADAPEDEGLPKKHYIWWTDSYHFTTDEKGGLIQDLSPEDLLNPIGKKPFVNITDDQDGSFWSEGGDDLIDGAILINQMITDMLSLAYIQGWGQGVVSGKNIPKKLEGGPHNWLIFDVENEGDPRAEVKFVSANPPLESWMRMTEQYTALWLSTLHLSPSVVAGKLDISNFPSAIAMMVEKAELTKSIEDKQKMFAQAERDLWEIVRDWQNLLLEKDALTPKFKEVGPFVDADVAVQFNDIKPVVTEDQKLKNLEMRQKLGLNTELELIQLDRGDMDDKDAEKILKKIKEEKLKNAARFMQNMGSNDQEESPAQDEQNEVPPSRDNMARRDE